MAESERLGGEIGEPVVDAAVADRRREIGHLPHARFPRELEELPEPRALRAVSARRGKPLDLRRECDERGIDRERVRRDEQREGEAHPSKGPPEGGADSTAPSSRIQALRHERDHHLETPRR